MVCTFNVLDIPTFSLPQYMDYCVFSFLHCLGLFSGVFCVFGSLALPLDSCSLVHLVLLSCIISCFIDYTLRIETVLSPSLIGIKESISSPKEFRT